MTRFQKSILPMMVAARGDFQACFDGHNWEPISALDCRRKLATFRDVDGAMDSMISRGCIVRNRDAAFRFVKLGS